MRENGPGLWRALFPVPGADSHKYSRGTALIRGGAVMTGASRLAARAAQRMGAGLVTLAAPGAALPVYAEALESVIVKPCDELAQWEALLAGKADALLLGPGLGLGEGRKEEVLAALATRRPVILDADALSVFADAPQALFQSLHPQCVLTPHEGEFARLFGRVLPPEPPPPGPRPQGAGESGGKVARACQASELAGCTVLLKGAETVIAAPGAQPVINRNAPPWLATGGSGDVLAGMILGLAAQKMPVFEAACAAAWLHGAVAAAHGPGLIAEDIVAGIPHILQELLAA